MAYWLNLTLALMNCIATRMISVTQIPLIVMNGAQAQAKPGGNAKWLPHLHAQAQQCVYVKNNVFATIRLIRDCGIDNHLNQLLDLLANVGAEESSGYAH